MSALADLPLSRLMLGTVQFGMPYGIANRSGQPDYETVRAILSAAYEGGVRCLDTAAAYGTSEETLGRALAELGLADRMTVVTKIMPLTEAYPTERAAALIEESVVRSLQRLRVEALPVCLFHWEENSRYAEALLQLKMRGLVQHVGCSVTTPQGAASLLASGWVEVLQVPANLLDRRFTGATICGQAQTQGILMFGRSVYLQGLLLMPEADIPAHLAEVIPTRRRLAHLAAEAGMGMQELALRYLLGVEGIACVLAGVETPEQIWENTLFCARGPLDEALRHAIDATVPALPDSLLDPGQWAQRTLRSEPK
jgi:aryl-alcohol dehydrogenase-like predicted oxidoreductase